MTSTAVTAAPIAPTASTAKPGAKPERPANLDADLAKAQGQLADWVACPSCKTPEGKAKIEEITAKVDAIKSKMEAVEKARPPAADATQPSTRNAAGTQAGSAVSTLGGVVDAYA